MRIFRRKKNKVLPNDVEKAQDPVEHKDRASGLLLVRRRDVRVGRVLGEGGFSQVLAITLKKKTKDTTEKRTFALKRTRPDLRGEAQERSARHLQRECRIMALLQGHENVLSIRGVAGAVEGRDSFFLVTDLLRETMAVRLRRWESMGPSPQDQFRYKLQYALQLAKALAHCHERGVVYRDCKTENFGFDDDKEHTVRLFDFGLSREMPVSENGEDAFRMTACGTLRYIAPEVYHRGRYNCKADTFGWAMTLVEMMTGKKPFPHMTPSVHKVLVLEGGGRPSLTEFPPDLQHILRRSWTQFLEQRWTMARVIEALEPYVESECSRMAPVDDALEPCGRVVPRLTPKAILPWKSPTYPSPWTAMRKKLHPPPRTVLALAA